jgi:hypothetical protein
VGVIWRIMAVVSWGWVIWRIMIYGIMAVVSGVIWRIMIYGIMVAIRTPVSDMPACSG